MTGEPLDDVRRKLDDAQAILAQDIAAETTVPNAYFDAGTLLLRNASTLTEAGRPAEAAAIFGTVLDTSALSRRDLAYFRARRAAALALGGEPDEAATVGLLSISDAQVMRTERTVAVLHDLSAGLTPWSGRPMVRLLRDALRQAAGSTRSTTG
ncbi:hypothetical protein [Actinokineospora enzanensis]|uniref:hypothetical protein n=1 Tax=Actinokineospora enzanensis TaxID=155975 RepID=UPI000372DAD0|nr:hypothetical protein [Actinokineospora enzanensis]